jgi:hypothetical protein
VSGIVIIHKRDRAKLPSDLAGLGRVEFTGYPDLVSQLTDKLPHFLGDTRMRIAVASSRAPLPTTAEPAPEPAGLRTDFAGRHVDLASWRLDVGVPQMARQDCGLWVEWDGSVTYSRSGNLALKRPLPDAFEVEAVLTGHVFGIGWDPGVYLYAGDGADMVLGANLMPPVAAWGIAEPICVVRTPRVSGQVGRLNFNHFLTAPAAAGAAVRVRLRVRGSIAEATISGKTTEELPLPGKPTQLVVGAYRWSAQPGRAMRQSARYCVNSFSCRELTA